MDDFEGGEAAGGDGPFWRAGGGELGERVLVWELVA